MVVMRRLALVAVLAAAAAIGPVTGTDHFYFAQEQIPAVSVLHFPYEEYHLPSERMELVDDQKLEDAVDLATALVEHQLAEPAQKTT